MSYDKKRWKKASETTDKDILQKKDICCGYGIVERAGYNKTKCLYQ